MTTTTHELSIIAIPGQGVRVQVKDKAGVEDTAIINLDYSSAKKLGDEIFKAACIAEEN